MYAKPYVCNGQATGKQCKHYWHTVVPLDVQNAVALHRGETNRMCTLHPGLEIRLTSESGQTLEMATFCNRYEPSSRDYDPSLERFDPLSPEEIEALREVSAPVTITSRNPSVLERLRALFRKENQ